jgi:choline dehydrogenase-like flavoprotein
VNTSLKFDAIVVGSGVSGGWAAKELAEKGFKTLLLERGRPIRHAIDYVGEHRPAWQRKFRGLPDRALIEQHYFQQARVPAYFDDTTVHFWHRDSDTSYIDDASAPFDWKRAGVLGGRSLLWARQVNRWSDLDFTANARDGHGVDWPIRYADLAPWYSHVERFIGVSGSREGLTHLPDGEFQKPMELNAAELAVKRAVEQCWRERRVIIGRVAVLTEALGERMPCHYCGPCQRGCSTGSYFSSLSSTLPAAEKTGNLTVVPHAIVESLGHDDAAQNVTGVFVVDAQTRERRHYRGRVVFLCASTVASTQILLNSRSERYPEGFANSSGVLGKYLMDHVYGVRVGGTLPGMTDLYTRGNRPNGMYVPRFRNLGDKASSAPFLRGYNFQGGAERVGWREMARRLEPAFGVQFKQRLRNPGPWQAYLLGFGEMLPIAENSMYLDFKQRDQYGIPRVGFSVRYRENEQRMIDDMLAEGAAMLRAAGATDIRQSRGLNLPGQAVHELGTARMGRDPRTSVLNGFNQAHDLKNLYVTDGACMTSGSCVSPSLTYMALTARAADHAAYQLRAGVF